MLAELRKNRKIKLLRSQISDVRNIIKERVLLPQYKKKYEGKCFKGKSGITRTYNLYFKIKKVLLVRSCGAFKAKLFIIEDLEYCINFKQKECTVTLGKYIEVTNKEFTNYHKLLTKKLAKLNE